MSINDLKLGQKAFINNIYGDKKLAKRLSALGCTKGCPVEITNKAPFGDPIVLSLRGYKIEKKKKHANNITVEALALWHKLP